MSEGPAGDPITKRSASPEDEDFLAAVYASTRREEVAAWGWPREQGESFIKMQYDARRRSYQAAFEDAEWSILLAGDIRAGSMIVRRSTSEIRLVDIALLAEYRNRGFGSTLIAELIEESQQRNVPLRLSVLQGNRAIHLYRRLGFVGYQGDGMYMEMELHP
jgi:ribosomal protein S18 acetylase RimI-like enzyme